MKSGNIISLVTVLPLYMIISMWIHTSTNVNYQTFVVFTLIKLLSPFCSSFL